jgi:hypothetical protein
MTAHVVLLEIVTPMPDSAHSIMQHTQICVGEFEIKQPYETCGPSTFASKNLPKCTQTRKLIVLLLVALLGGGSAHAGTALRP